MSPSARVIRVFIEILESRIAPAISIAAEWRSSTVLAGMSTGADGFFLCEVTL